MLPTPLLIAKKRDGKVLSDPEIEQFVQGVVKKEVSGEQTGAMLMAIFLKGMTVQETISLTRSMRFSGEQLNWPQYKVCSWFFLVPCVQKCNRIEYTFF